MEAKRTTKNKRLKLLAFFSLLISCVTLFAIVFSNVNSNKMMFVSGMNEPAHSITLNSGNKVTSNGDKVQKTKENNNVTFTYAGVNASTSGHVTLNNGGTIVNKDHIRSIEKITASFNTENALRFKVSYDGATWGGNTTMISGYTYELSSNPYYLHIEATSSVTISSVVITYSCLENANAHEGEEEQETLIGVFNFWNDGSVGNGSNGTVVDTSYVNSSSYASLNGNSKTLISSVTASYVYQGRFGGIGFNSNSSTGSITFNLANNIRPNKVVVYAAKTANENTSLTLNDSTKNVTTSCQSSGSTLNSDNYDALEWTFNSTQSSLEFEGFGNKSKKLVVFHIYLYGISGPTYVAPEESVIGFSATDANAANYYSDEVFDDANALSVHANKTGGSTVELSKGGPEGYSYIVKNSSDVTIDTSVAFGEEGLYTLIVSYKNFIPVEIQLTVGFRVALTGIEVNSTTLSFNTAQKLSDFTNGITVNLTYNRESENETGVTYAEFASKNIALTLINPSSVNANINTVFGTAGTWTIKVTSTVNPSIFGQLEITVSAIQVQTITVSGGSTSVEEGKTLQLTASVGPETATNKAITWSSNHENIATVNNTGLVTAVAAGEARITATAQDGSATFGYLDITVTEKAVAQDEGTYTQSSGNLTVGSYVIFTNQISDGTAKAMATQNTNNRTAVSATASGGTIEKDSNSEFSAFIVQEGLLDDTYAFYDPIDEGYLYAASASSNWLRTEAELSNNSSFTVTGSTEKNIAAQGSNSRNILRYNPNGTSPIFSCYGSGNTQILPYIYEKAGDPVYPTAIQLSGTSSIGVGQTSQLEVTYTPNDTTVKSVTFESSDDLVASVSASGLVTGIKSGTATITATAHGGITATLNITVSNISVTSVTLNKTSTSITAGGTETLVATINPSNATNKNVTWSTSDNSVATVNDGVVTAVGAGQADITVTSVDGNKSATCRVTVTSSGGSSETNKTYSFTSSTWEADGGDWSSGQAGAGYSNGGVQVTANASGANATSPDSFDCVESITVNYCTNSSKGAGSIELKVGNTTFDTSKSVTTSGGTTGRDLVFTGNGTLSGNVKITVTCTTNSIYIRSITVVAGTAEPINPTAIAVNPSSAELSPGGTKTLSVNYTPAGANQNKAVTWTSSNTNVATVDTSGKVTVKSTATAGQTATITARLTNLTSIYSTCTITVVEAAKADHTILIYLCGSNLESDYASSNEGLATGDIQEILQVSNQPDDVNIIIETGGANKWSSRYGISSTYLQRHHVSNRQLVTDDSLTYANMGSASTLQSFIEYGLQNYPAERTGLILWNHGGGMKGVCYDEKKSDDNLLSNEVKQAVTNALNNKGEANQKLEWIGYDACLMQVQDIAEMNSSFANYMIASEESEAGYGWDYNTWVDDLYAHSTTPVILKAIVDGFITDNGGTSSSSNDQTLSYLDLSYASAYETAWENMALQLKNKITSSNKSDFNSLVGNCKHYADSDYTYFGTFDAKDFVDKLSNNSTFNPGSSYTSAVLTAHSNLVAYSSCGKGAGKSYGLAMYWSINSDCEKGYYYKPSMTNFTNWKYLVDNYGY